MVLTWHDSRGTRQSSLGSQWDSYVISLKLLKQNSSWATCVQTLCAWKVSSELVPCCPSFLLGLCKSLNKRNTNLFHQWMRLSRILTQHYHQEKCLRGLGAAAGAPPASLWDPSDTGGHRCPIGRPRGPRCQMSYSGPQCGRHDRRCCRGWWMWCMTQWKNLELNS